MRNFLKKLYFRYLWWLWQGMLILVSVFFLLLGIYVFIAAYRLDDPFNFVLCFFSSNLMILISLVLLAGFVYRMVCVYRLIGKRGERPEDPRNQ